MFLFVLFPHHYPLALAVNKSPAVYILSPASLDGLWRENRGSVNRLTRSRIRSNNMYDTNQSTCFDLRWGFLPLDIDIQNCRQYSHTDTHRFLGTVHTHSHLQWSLDKLTSSQWQLAMFRRNTSRTRRPLETKYGHLTPTSSSHLNSMIAFLQNQ